MHADNKKKQTINEDVNKATAEPDNDEAVSENETESLKKRICELENDVAKKDAQQIEYIDLIKRTAAEFDNYKKRTCKEKDAWCNIITADVVMEFLDVMDNLDRAVTMADKEPDSPLKDGLALVHREMKDVLKKIGVEEIDSIGEKFDPVKHEAVMHVKDENLDENVIVEEFKKGYIYKDRVIRHSCVKVAN